jgi:hypothetical protein
VLLYTAMPTAVLAHLSLPRRVLFGLPKTARVIATASPAPATHNATAPPTLTMAQAPLPHVGNLTATDPTFVEPESPARDAQAAQEPHAEAATPLKDFHRFASAVPHQSRSSSAPQSESRSCLSCRAVALLFIIYCLFVLCASKRSVCVRRS